MRPAPQRDDLLALRRVVDDDARLQLTGLSGSAVAALAGGRPDRSLLRLDDGAAGNPLYITEPVAALARSSSLTVSEETRSWRAVPRQGRCQRPSRIGLTS